MNERDARGKLLTKWNYLQTCWEIGKDGDWFKTQDILNALENIQHMKRPLAACHQELKRLEERSWIKSKLETFEFGKRRKWKVTDKMKEFHENHDSFINSKWGKNPIIPPDNSKG